LACSTTPTRSPTTTQTRADEAVADRVYLALNADPTYFYRHVDVRVDSDVAASAATVWSTDAIYRARQIAREVPEVTRVVTNHLDLEREGLTNGRPR
jgi:osmotically-inducible protein OsmY